MLKQFEQDPIDLLEECRDSDGYVCGYGLPNGFTLIEEGDWLQEYKYQQASQIVKHDESNTYYMLSQSRSGSYHSGWEFDATDIMEAEQVTETITVTKWVAV